MNKKVIVVEDDPVLGKLFRDILLMSELDVELISQGRLALKRILEEPPDILLLDLHLPEVSGLDILEAVEANPACAKTHIAVVTADGLRAKLVNERVDLVLLKPVGMNQLLELVQRLA
jgi:two-component system cell cycle response regulator DivK